MSLKSASMLELRAGFDERMDALGQPFELERTGDEFDGILLPLPAIDPSMELGSDWREVSTLEVRRDKVPDIKFGDVLLQTSPFWATEEFHPIPKWKVVRREDNAANFTIRYWVVSVVTGKDDQ